MKQLYTNGTILTMEQPEYAESVLVEDGMIRAVGSRQELENCQADEIIDLQGRTMMPAFIDPHSHFSAAANTLLQIPLGDLVTIEEIKNSIADYIRSNKIQKDQWVRGNGYDHNQLPNKQWPTRWDLDQVSPDNPVILSHKSGHMGVFNTRALEILGVTEDTPTPEGGMIEKRDGKVTGYMEENAFQQFQRMIPMQDIDEMVKACVRTQDMYASHGITTVQEGFMAEQLAFVYQKLLKEKRLRLDVVAYPGWWDMEKMYDMFPDYQHEYRDNFRLGGIKIFLDGSPQGRTAWMRTPYEGGDGQYCGYGTMKDEEVQQALRDCAQRKIQLLAHCNGDRAAQQYIEAVGKVREEYPDIAQRRPVMIHAQLADVDQLPKMKEYGIIPSFFVAHVYHWGDIHVQNFGLERASRISPAGSALKEGMRFTFHQDTPVIPPDMMETVWCAVNRRTKSGQVLGEEQAIPVLEALKAVTINAAYQYFEEDTKGSIRAGKRADFVILDRNPLETEPMELRSVKILQTIKAGETLYKA